jgi:hypothetical protein
MCVGDIEFALVPSAAAAVSVVLLERARYTVLLTVAPSTAFPPTGRRIVNGAGVGASLLPDAVL